MVGALAKLWSAMLEAPPAIFFQEGAPTVWEQLDPSTRAKLLLVFWGFVILALGITLGIVLGGHHVRRLARSRTAKPQLPPRSPHDGSDSPAPRRPPSADRD